MPIHNYVVYFQNISFMMHIEDMMYEQSKALVKPKACKLSKLLASLSSLTKSLLCECSEWLSG